MCLHIRMCCPPKANVSITGILVYIAAANREQLLLDWGSRGIGRRVDQTPFSGMSQPVAFIFTRCLINSGNSTNSLCSVKV